LDDGRPNDLKGRAANERFLKHVPPLVTGQLWMQFLEWTPIADNGMERQLLNEEAVAAPEMAPHSVVKSVSTRLAGQGNRNTAQRHAKCSLF